MFNDFFEVLKENHFVEKPVDAKTFVESSDYLGQPPLSEIQYTIVEAMSQIYRKEDVIDIMGDVGEEYFKKYTKNELILQLGKGSGKDFVSTVACAYVVYKMLCLKDPATYYGKPPGDAIDIINVAINAAQAKNVFFKGFKLKIEKSPWFAGKYNPKADSIEFDKSITVYSGHSERESHEGLNLFMAVLDEISGFASEVATGNEQGKTADNIYKAFRGTVDSRFPDLGKVVLLSFPRYQGDFISQRYDSVIAEKEVIEKSHKFIINEDLPHDNPDNNFEISWDEDHILSYKIPKIFALKRPTWEVNPTRKIDDFKIAFLTDLGDAMMRFLCTPTFSSDAFFKQKDKLINCMTLTNPVDGFRRFAENFKPDPDKIYYVHADLAQKHDKCAVAIAHVDKWVNIQVIKDYEQVAPIVIVDAVAWWEPKAEGPVNLSEVKQWIINLRRQGFNIGIVSFDRWQCLPGSALVYTPSGPVPIKEINAGDMVVTRFGESTISNKVSTGEQEVFRITTRLGYEFEATKNHKMLTQNGWKTVSDLSLEDGLILNNSFKYNNSDIVSEDQAYALGALIADGWINNKKDQMINFTCADEDFYQEFHRCLVEGWGFKNKVQKSLNKKTKGSIVDTYSYFYWDKAMISRMRDAGMIRGKSKTKVIPSSVLSSSPKVRAAFLAGYIDGDGGIQKYIDRNGIARQRLTMDTSSEALVNQLTWMLLSLGLEPTRLRQVRGDRVNHRLTLEGKKGRRALEIISPILSRKNSMEESCDKKVVAERWEFDNGSLSLKIRKIESIGIRETYDISVPEHEEFVCNGFVTHNSFDIQNELKAVGIRTDTVSVAKKHYEDLAMMIYEERVAMPMIPLLLEEMSELKIMKGNRVDHPRKKSKDLSDAVCGAVFGAISHTPKEMNIEIDIHTWGSADKVARQQRAMVELEDRQMPQDVKNFLDNLKLI